MGEENLKKKKCHRSYSLLKSTLPYSLSNDKQKTKENFKKRAGFLEFHRKLRIFNNALEVEGKHFCSFSSLAITVRLHRY